MPRSLSDDYHRSATALAPADVPLTALEITHLDLNTPIRVVNNTENITIEGNEYIALRFDAVFADDQQGQVPRAQIRIDNVGRALTEPLDRIGGGAGAAIRAMQVMRDADPKVIEWEVTMDLAGVTVNQLEVTATLGFDPLLSRAAVTLRHDPQNSPGLF